MDKMPRRNDGKISEFPFVSLIYPLLPVFHPSTVFLSLSLCPSLSTSLSLSLSGLLHPSTNDACRVYKDRILLLSSLFPLRRKVSCSLVARVSLSLSLSPTRSLLVALSSSSFPLSRKYKEQG